MNDEEELWFDQVEDILSERGLSLDSNDGWTFMYENGFSPEQAVQEMIYG